MTVSLSTHAAAPPPPPDLAIRAERDDPVGMRLLGQFYWRHANDPDAMHKAAFWIERAATVDDARAQVLASHMYQNGLGVKKNPERAYWFAMHAARHGDPDSQFRYAQFFETGYGTKRNVAEANHWYRRAAEQGHERAARLLGQFLARQADSADALREAVRYLSIAARQGDELSRQTLVKLSGRLNRMAQTRPNVNIRKSPSLTADVVAITSPASAMYYLGEAAQGWVELYRPADHVTGYAFASALTGGGAGTGKTAMLQLQSP